MNKWRLHEEELHSLYMPKCTCKHMHPTCKMLFCIADTFFVEGWGEKNEDYITDSCVHTDVNFYKQDLQDVLGLEP